MTLWPKNQEPLSKFEKLVIGFSVVFILFIFMRNVVYATSILLAVFSSQVTFTNAAADTTEVVTYFELSGQSLVDGSFISSDTLDSALVSNTTEIPSQPPSLLLRMLVAESDDGGVFTTETTASNNATVDDMTLLPAVPMVNDAYYFGTDHQFRILTLSVVTAGDWIGTLTWEYYNGAAWIALSNIDDRTNQFTSTGAKTVSFTVPTDWAEVVINGSTNYWIRARVSAFTSLTTQPLGTQSWWQTGQWWTFVDSIDQDQQIEYQLGLGGPDIVANHHFFPGVAGYTISDNSSMELGNDFDIEIEGYFDTDATVAGRDIINKSSAIRIYTPSASTIRLDLNSGAVIADIPSPVVNGVYTLTVESNGVNVTMRIIGNSVLVGEVTVTTASVTDNGSGWEFATDGIMPFVSHLTIDVSSIEVLQLRPQELIGLTLTDRSGTGNTVTTSFPINSSAVSSFITALSPTGAVSVGEAEVIIPPVFDTITTSLIDPDIDTGGLPFGDVVNSISDGTNLHPEIIWTMIAFSLISLSGFGAFKVTGGSLPAAIFMMVLVALFTVNIGTNGLIPMWVFILFSIKAFAIMALTWNRQKGAGLA